MQTADPVDVVLEDVALGVTEDWPSGWRRAALAVAGWGPSATSGVSLASAAAAFGGSRETVRRARDRLSAAMRKDVRVEECASRVQHFLEHEAANLTDLSVELVSARAAAAGVVSSPDRFDHVIRTLHAVGYLALVNLATDAHTGRRWVVTDAPAATRTVIAAQLADGRPHTLLELPPMIAGSAQSQIQAGGDELVAQGVARWLDVPGHPLTWLTLASEVAFESQSVRAVRRLLTMTGPLPWVDLLAAWSRGQGRPPHRPLPADVAVLTAWLAPMPGLRVRSSKELDGQPVVEAVPPDVDMDRTSALLHRALASEPAGLSRVELLEAATNAGLRGSSVAAALTYHPAVTNVSRARWALRTSPDQPRFAAPADEPQTPSVRRPARARGRPTTYTWSAMGELLLEFSAPSGPSPVFAVPSAVASILEGRELPLAIPGKPATGTLAVRNARAWGFGSLLATFAPSPGDRFDLACDLVAGTATLGPAHARKAPR